MSPYQVELVGGPRDGERVEAYDANGDELVFSSVQETLSPLPKPAVDGWVDVTPAEFFPKRVLVDETYRRRPGPHPQGVRFIFEYPGSKKRLA
ncbi:hypothetical protein QN354_09505 [Cryobacterium sp. 5I3]|uniref:hypothetical protein n=1 Tax=Cryobacterium sp. 5I3 TaxID=3048592 RepID=UPI002B22570F|nr:hypothetical protein [Cryobacterium sp. 5I3]MEB0201991.1 hypothetical protein [Cryobacterium sp. 5I3]